MRLRQPAAPHAMTCPGHACPPARAWGRSLLPWLLAGLACLAPTAQAATAQTGTQAERSAPTPTVPPAPLSLRWTLERNAFPPDAPGGRAQAAFLLVNQGSQPLPAQGWALYFTCVSGVVTGAGDGPFVLEQVVGTLYRLRPTAGFEPLAPGRSRRLGYQQPEPLSRLDKAPQGPYLVFDAQPAQGRALASYTIEPLVRPEQLAKAAGDPHTVRTPDDLYRRQATTADLPEASLPPVFPTPLRLEPGTGQLRWSAMPVLQAPPALKGLAGQADAMLQPYFAPRAAPAGGQHLLQLDLGSVAGQSSPEAYELAIDASRGARITAASPAGVARGLQSLRELLPLRPTSAAAPSPVDLPALVIRDAPRFAYRGLMMDVARNFQPKAVVLRTLDLMARYKLNALHLHLTDDEGWRLQIAALPELTQVGARRGHTADGLDHLPPAYGSGPDVADAHGSGHYSRADYIAILRHAAALHIDVIPEIEMPGHARAAVKAMESRSARLALAGRPDAQRFRLNDPNDRSVYRSPQLYRDHLMDPGLPSTYAFIDTVVREVASMHREAGVPLRLLHVGGDEAPNGAWEHSPASQALMRQLKTTDTADLWDHFYSRVQQIARRHGAGLAGWEELGARKVKLRGQDKLIPNPRFVGQGFRLYVWNNTEGTEDLAHRLANAGYPIVLAPATRLYFDMAHNANPEEPGVNWAAYTDVDAVFSFIPLDDLRKTPTNPAPLPGLDGLTSFGQRQVLGLQGTLFSETVRNIERLDHQLMPRLLALAERAWAANPAWAQEADADKAAALHAQAWSVFANQLGKRVLPRLDADGAAGSAIQYRMAPPGLRVQDGRVLVNHPLPGFTLRYTTDDSEPTVRSAVVTESVVTARGRIRVAAFDRNGRAGRSSLAHNP